MLIVTRPAAVAFTRKERTTMRRRYTSLYQTAPIPLIPVILSYTESVWFSDPIRSGDPRNVSILPPPARSPCSRAAAAHRSQRRSRPPRLLQACRLPRSSRLRQNELEVG